jgi:hypothetical protein
MPLDTRIVTGLPTCNSRSYFVLRVCFPAVCVLYVVGRLFKEGPAHEWDDTAEFAPGKLTEVLRNTQFLATVDLVLELDQILQGMSAWCEQCPCHGHLQAI